MWSTSAGQRVSVEEYLRNPELEKLELVDGVLVETGAGDKIHAWTHAHCGSLLSSLRMVEMTSGLLAD